MGLSEVLIPPCSRQDIEIDQVAWCSASGQVAVVLRGIKRVHDLQRLFIHKARAGWPIGHAQGQQYDRQQRPPPAGQAIHGPGQGQGQERAGRHQMPDSEPARSLRAVRDQDRTYPHGKQGEKQLSHLRALPLPHKQPGHEHDTYHSGNMPSRTIDESQPTDCRLEELDSSQDRVCSHRGTAAQAVLPRRSGHQQPGQIGCGHPCPCRYQAGKQAQAQQGSIEPKPKENPGRVVERVKRDSRAQDEAQVVSPIGSCLAAQDKPGRSQHRQRRQGIHARDLAVINEERPKRSEAGRQDGNACLARPTPGYHIHERHGNDAQQHGQKANAPDSLAGDEPEFEHGNVERRMPLFRGDLPQLRPGEAGMGQRPSFIPTQHRLTELMETSYEGQNGQQSNPKQRILEGSPPHRLSFYMRTNHFTSSSLAKPLPDQNADEQRRHDDHQE